MTRITKDFASEIVCAALEKAGIFERRKALSEEQKAIGEACRVFALGGEKGAEKVEKIRKSVASLLREVPPEVRGNGLGFNLERHAWVRIGGKSCHLELPQQSVCPQAIIIEAGNPIAERWLKYCADLDALREEEKRTTAMVRGTVEKFTTVAKLLEAWPEAAELIPATKKPAKQLPAVPVADLNKMLKLPTTK